MPTSDPSKKGRSCRCCSFSFSFFLSHSRVSNRRAKRSESTCNTCTQAQSSRPELIYFFSSAQLCACSDGRDCSRASKPPKTGVLSLFPSTRFAVRRILKRAKHQSGIGTVRHGLSSHSFVCETKGPIEKREGIRCELCRWDGSTSDKTRRNARICMPSTQKKRACSIITRRNHCSAKNHSIRFR